MNSLTVSITLEPIYIESETTFQQVLTALNAIIKRIYGNNEESFYNPRMYSFNKNTPWYELFKKDNKHFYRWLAVYPVSGDSEGHYVHVDLVHGYDNDCGETKHLFALKTFNGFNRAQEIAQITQFLLTNGNGFI